MDTQTARSSFHAKHVSLSSQYSFSILHTVSSLPVSDNKCVVLYSHSVLYRCYVFATTVMPPPQNAYILEHFYAAAHRTTTLFRHERKPSQRRYTCVLLNPRYVNTSGILPPLRLTTSSTITAHLFSDTSRAVTLRVVVTLHCRRYCQLHVHDVVEVILAFDTCTLCRKRVNPKHLNW